MQLNYYNMKSAPVSLRMLRFYLFVLASFSAGQYARAVDMDSFYAASDMEEKCLIADELAQEYLGSNLDSLKILGYELLVASNKAKNEFGINYSRVIIGNYLIRSADELRGLELLRQAKNYFVGIEDYAKGAEICNEIGNGYQFINRIEESVSWYKLSPDKRIQYIAEINLAQAYMMTGQFERGRKAAEHYRDWVLEQGSLKDVSNAYAVLGRMALDQEKNKEAIYYFEQCYKFAQKGGARVQQANAYTNIAIAVYLQGKPEESVPLFEKALELRKKVNNIAYVCDAYLNMGGIYFELGEYEKALDYYGQGVVLARNHEKYLNEIELLEAVKEVYAIGEPAKAAATGQEVEQAKVNLEQQKKMQSSFDKLLSEELKETARIQADGFVREESKWPFYIGGFVLFAGFYLLAVRRRLI